MKAIYEASLGDMRSYLSTLKAIICNINSQSQELNIKNYGETVDVPGRYDFENVGSKVKVRLSQKDGKPEIEIQGDEAQVRETKSQLLKIVGGLELS